MIFYEFPKSGKKRKRKKVNSTRLKLAQADPRTGENAPARFVVFTLRRGPWLFEKLVNSPAHYFYVSLTFTPRPLTF
jgi:hypothetical protein